MIATPSLPDTLLRIRKLVALGKVRFSEHGWEEILEDGIPVEDLIEGVRQAKVVEDYPDAFKGPTVLALQDVRGKPVHVVWGLARNTPGVATLVTAYFPDPQKWYDDWVTRRKP